jgi:hypothetical protein
MEQLHPFWNQLLESESRAHLSKWRRLSKSPFWYPVSMMFNKIVYPVVKKEWRKKIKTFFGIYMTTALPSGTDVLLNRIKSHDSEIRLSKFLTRHLCKGQTFIDIGAHHGYYSLLAAALVGKEGKVFAIEASKKSFELLQYNTIQYNSLYCNQKTIKVQNMHALATKGGPKRDGYPAGKGHPSKKFPININQDS